MKRSSLRFAGAITTLLVCSSALIGSVSVAAQPLATAATAEQPLDYYETVDDWVKEVGPEFVKSGQILGDLTAWAVTKPGIYESGYVASLNDQAAVSMQILWHGDSPLRGEMLQKAEELGIKATIVEYPYSMVQIKDAQAAILDNRAKLADLGYKLSSVSAINSHSTALSIQGSFLESMDLKARAAATTAIEDLAKELGGTEVELQDDRGEYTPFFSIVNDSSPFYAGGYMRSTVGTLCSTGFSIRYNGYNRVTTASHCNDSYRARDNSNTSYSSKIATTIPFGANVLAATGRGRIFNGAWYTSPTPWVNVKGYQDVNPGDYVCSGGGNSNIHCNIRVENLSVAYTDGYNNFWGIHAQQINGQMASASGDSGGPMLVPVDGGFRAVGLIQGTLNKSTYGLGNCPNMRDTGGFIICTRDVVFTSMRSVNDALGATLLTE